MKKSCPESASDCCLLDSDKAIRLQLIIAFNGDVTLAETALAFVNGNPDASTEYRHFKEWQQERYKEYCRSRGIKTRETTSTEAR